MQSYAVIYFPGSECYLINTVFYLRFYQDFVWVGIYVWAQLVEIRRSRYTSLFPILFLRN